MKYDKDYLHNMYNATSVGDKNGEPESYVDWMEKQLIARLEKTETLEQTKEKPTNEPEMNKSLFSRFKNENLINNSVMLRAVFYELMNGADPYSIIERLIQQHENAVNEFIRFSERDTRPFRLKNGDTFVIDYPKDIIEWANNNE